MRLRSGMLRGGVALALLAGGGLPAGGCGGSGGGSGAPPGATQVLYVLDAVNQIWRYSPSAPGTVLGAAGLSGLLPIERVVGIDVHPGTGQMYGLAVDGNGFGVVARYLAIDPLTGVTAQVGANIPLPAAAGDAGFGFDLSPTATIARVINTGGANLRINSTTGVPISPDPPINPPGQQIQCAAYDRNTPGGGPLDTTLYTINPVAAQLQTIGGINQAPSANSGTLMNPLPLGATIDAAGFVAFDIVGVSDAFAIFDGDPTPAVSTGLYRVNLASGTATLVGLLGAGPSLPVMGMAVR